MSMQTWFIIAVGVMAMAVVAKKLISKFQEIVAEEDRSTYEVRGQEWEAFDPATQRVLGRAGVSFHRNIKDLAAFVQEYWEGLPEHPTKTYARPVSSSFTCRVGRRAWEQVKRSRNGWLDTERGTHTFGVVLETPAAKLP